MNRISYYTEVDTFNLLERNANVMSSVLHTCLSVFAFYHLK